MELNAREKEREGEKVKERRRRRRARVDFAFETIPIVIGCHRKASSPREKKSRTPRGRGEGRVTRSTDGGPGAPLWALPRRWRYYRKLPPSKEEWPRCSVAAAERGVSRLLGVSPTSRNVGFTTGARRCSSLLQPPLPILFPHLALPSRPFFFFPLRISLSLGLVQCQTESRESRIVCVFLSLSLSFSSYKRGV